jgi:hypothetical protein
MIASMLVVAARSASVEGIGGLEEVGNAVCGSRDDEEDSGHGKKSLDAGGC